MTPKQEKVLEKLKANDQHPERGEITLVTNGDYKGYFVRESLSLIHISEPTRRPG